MHKSKLLEAVEFATLAHGDQKRKYTFEPYMVHPLRVAQRAWERGIGIEAVIGAILHDVVEDTDLCLVDIEIAFGPTVAAVVHGLTEASLGLKGQPEWNRAARKELDLVKLSEQPAVIQNLKMLDLIDNLSTVPPSDGFLDRFMEEAKELVSGMEDADFDLAEELVYVIGKKQTERERWLLDQALLQGASPTT